MAQGDAPAPPLDAERARLRAAGYTDDEISKYFVERLRGASQQPTAAGAAPVQGTMTGVLGNASAVLSHARGTIPALKADLANLSNSTASVKSRRMSALKLAGAAVVIGALGYAIYQEWQIHIVNAPPTSAAQRQKAEAEAATAAAAARGGNTPIKGEGEIGGMIGGRPPPSSSR